MYLQQEEVSRNSAQPVQNRAKHAYKTAEHTPVKLPVSEKTRLSLFLQLHLSLRL